MDFLKENPKEWFSATEIADATNTGKSSILRSLKTLRDSTNFIKHKYEEGFDKNMRPCKRNYVYKI